MIQFYLNEWLRSEKRFMDYLNEVLERSSSEYSDSVPSEPLDSCMVFDLSKGGRLVASRMRGKIKAADFLSDIMSADELAFLTDYLNGYGELPVMVSTARGFAVAITLLYPSTSLCVLSFPSIGGENFLRVVKNQRWNIALSPVAERRQLRRTGIREGHIEECVRLRNLLSNCFAPCVDSIEYSRSEFLKRRTLFIAEYVSRRSRITLGDSVVISNDFDLPLFISFVLLLTLGGRASRADECAKISLREHACGIETVIVEKPGQDHSRISETLADICGRANIPFECFVKDGRLCTRIVPVRRDWAYLGIKSPEKE